MRVLVTGIGGSIGCHVLAHFLQHTNWHIIGIDSFRHKGLTDRVETILQRDPDNWRPRVTILTHDLLAPISGYLSSKIGQIDYIVNLASLSDVQASIDDPASFILNNVQITTTILDYARNLPNTWLEAFIHFSTDEVYGPSGEGAGHLEWSTILPSNPYAASKAAQEAIAISYWRSYGVPLIITNTMNNFGEMQQSNKFPAIVQSMLSKGEPVTIHGNEKTIGSRYYIHSRNVADALLFILKNVKPYRHKDGEIDRPERINIVGDKRVNNLELAKTIARLLDVNLEYKLVDFHKIRPGHDRHYGLDGTKLKEFGWKSPVSFEDSLESTLKWTNDHPEWLK